MLNHEDNSDVKIKLIFTKILNSKIVKTPIFSAAFYLYLAVMMVFVIDWNNLKIEDYFIITIAILF
ncbi:hypothetical protein CN281_28880 [Bacillus cereus]|nr:hypothetical protein CN281_28880 [Bacillus cereus]PFH83026.1 hypothetical protein COI78_30520 [Bacillus cereus]